MPNIDGVAKLANPSLNIEDLGVVGATRPRWALPAHHPWVPGPATVWGGHGSWVVGVSRP